jgi:hypothetical protein
MSYSVEFVAVSAFLGILLFLLVTPLALLGLAVLLVAAVAILVALIAGLVAAPFLLVGAARRRWSDGRVELAKEPVYAPQATVSRAQ